MPSSRPTRSTSRTSSSGPGPGTSGRAPSRRCGASARCRSSRSPRSPRRCSYVIPKGKGYYALTRHAHIAEASRHPEIFQSGQGATSIIDMPEEMLDFFGSMINMDNPRHARLRRIVSAAFNPRMIKSIEDRIELVADDVIDRVADRGGCDFVVEVAARLPLEIICDMMGIAAADYDTVFNASNVILSRRRPRVRAPRARTPWSPS